MDDDEVEETEEFEIKLLSNADLVEVNGTEKASVTIVDNDEEIVPNLVGLQQTQYDVAEGEGVLEVCVWLEQRILA